MLNTFRHVQMNKTYKIVIFIQPTNNFNYGGRKNKKIFTQIVIHNEIDFFQSSTKKLIFIAAVHNDTILT